MTHALIIGGGIAGPVTAMALQRAGIGATVYEAHATGAEGAGAFLTVAVNGLDALRVIGADTPVLAEGFPATRNVIFDPAGERLFEAPQGETLPDGTTTRAVRRVDLYGTLRGEARSRGIRIEHGKRLVGAETGPDGGVVAHFDDGARASGDLLVGADGIHSTTRRLIDPDAPRPRYDGLLNVGGYARDVSATTEPGAFHMTQGKHVFFAYTTAPAGETWWFANIPHSDEPDRAQLAVLSTEQWKRWLLDLVADDASPAAEIIDATTDILGRYGTYNMPAVPTWHNGPMIIVGDAAHATSPSSGQGASLAIEDAVVLAKCLRDAPDVQQAFVAYERLRRQRVEDVAALGAYGSGKKADAEVNDRPTAWMYQHHIDWNIPARP